MASPEATTSGSATTPTREAYRAGAGGVGAAVLELAVLELAVLEPVLLVLLALYARAGAGAGEVVDLACMDAEEKSKASTRK